MDWLTILGYLASVLVITSVLMKSILRFRWINLCGGIAYASYGFLIGAHPVFIFNTITIFINVFFLRKFYKDQDAFHPLCVQLKSEPLVFLINYYKDEIVKDFPGFDSNNIKSNIAILPMRNAKTAGIMLMSENGKEEVELDLNFVFPEYRDYYAARIMHKEYVAMFLEKGIKRFVAKAGSPRYNKYLSKIGYEYSEEHQQFRLHLAKYPY